jgi:ketosteroid isomerase-like protein
MSQENLQLLRSSVEHYLSGTGDGDRGAMLARIAELWAPDIVWDASELPLPELAGVIRGRDAVLEWWAQFFAAWEVIELFDYALLDAGDSAVVLLDQRLRARSTGVEASFGQYAQVVTFKDGLIVHLKLYLSQAAALEAVGRVE